jgi:hypothetical protein
MTIMHLVIGFLSGFIVGLALFSHAFSRAVVTGILAGMVIGALVVDGPDGLVKWVSYLPVEMTRLSVFWLGMIAGLLGGARIWSVRRVL